MPLSPRAPHARGDTIRVVTFNLEYGERVDSALAMFAADSGLSDADVVLLQEMDSSSTDRVATALGMAYVFYPAIYHPRAEQDFGNAILSRWPIVSDAKLILPHASRYARTNRTATAATLNIRDVHVRVYSTHLGTVLDIGPNARRDQLRAIIADADTFPRVILGGDMNSTNVGNVAREMGYAWPTEHGPRTMQIARVDHIFLKGLAVPASGFTGTVADNRQSSDHKAVWARAVIR